MRVNHEDTRVRKGIGDDDLIVDVLPRHRVVGLTVRVMHDPDHAYEGAKSCLSMNEAHY